MGSRLLVSLCLLVVTCRRSETPPAPSSSQIEVADAPTAPPVSAEESALVDEPFVWHLTARVLARYRTASDPSARLTQWHEYSTELGHFAFSPDSAAVVDFPFADGRVARLALRDLRREGRRVHADCQVGISWLFDGAGRTVGGCQLFDGAPVSLPSRVSLFSSSEQEIVLEVHARNIVGVDEPPRRGAPRFDPARPITDEVFESRAWNEASGDVRSGWDPRTRVPSHFLEPVE